LKPNRGKSSGHDVETDAGDSASHKAHLRSIMAAQLHTMKVPHELSVFSEKKFVIWSCQPR
jgi:hypothetical protein